ncbi:uncharacterized protein At4g02000-like [Eutrema salsugineum]|uniref:uncharacterized protein At4g02000-like n=1 Tax=Eutrema salsugineum TaxID=72664 RepID=UPI000CED3C4F|nr:uncharacterized protein At4g02000-like [Eutrema salsugineum]
MENRNPDPRSIRVKVKNSDNSALLMKYSLTLVGRVTNPKYQKVWSIVPFFTNRWKTSVRPIGADLGQGLFQFQFDNEDDVQLILKNRPYHYAKWMLIIQRWEPMVSRSFPSLIPFWIQIQRFPVHLWTHETIQSLGDSLGFCEEVEITSISARVRVHINGIKPLVTTSIVEYLDGEEVLASLVYEKLERYCSKCMMLTHEDKECTEFPSLSSNDTRTRKNTYWSQRMRDWT